MKKIIFLILLSINVLSYGQETSSLHGKILDGELFNEPLLMATVSIKNTNIATHTNFRGNFEFNALTPGTYEIVVQFLGYKTIELPITLKAGENIELLESLYAKTLALPSATNVTNVANELREVPKIASQKR